MNLILKLVVVLGVVLTGIGAGAMRAENTNIGPILMAVAYGCLATVIVSML